MNMEAYRQTDTCSAASLASDAAVVLKKGEGRLLKAGGAWVYDNEIARTQPEDMTGAGNGCILRVLDFDGFFLGWGIFNRDSRIRVRLLSRRESDVICPRFFRERMQAAWDYRKAVIDTSSCRVVFGEADFLPGLTIDKYEDILVVESLSLGLDLLKDLLLSCLVQVLEADGVTVRGIYERSDAKVREKEGLARTKGFLSEPFDTSVPITENGVRYIVDVKDGQKTGFFLDQKNNRRSIWGICRGADVLDCFTHTGSFALNAAKAGASHVLAVDASDLAIAQARENARLNGFEDRMEFCTADVFEFLPEERKNGRSYDVVILDPPAFTKSRESVKNAAKGYREINRQGLALVRDGGYLVTCSCSHFMEPELFAEAIARAAGDAHVRLRQVLFSQQAPDHPILWANDTSYYLKFYIFQVVRER